MMDNTSEIVTESSTKGGTGFNLYSFPALKINKRPFALPKGEEKPEKGIMAIVNASNPNSIHKVLNNTLYRDRDYYRCFFCDTRYIFKVKGKTIREIQPRERLARYNAIKKSEGLKCLTTLQASGGKNTYYDITVFNQLFFENTTRETISSKYKDYIDVIAEHVLDTIPDTFNTKFMILDLDEWASVGSARILSNPINIIYYTLRKDPEYLKKWGNLDILFVGENQCFRINTNEIDEKSHIMFNTLIRRLKASLIADTDDGEAEGEDIELMSVSDEEQSDDTKDEETKKKSTDDIPSEDDSSLDSIDDESESETKTPEVDEEPPSVEDNGEEGITVDEKELIKQVSEPIPIASTAMSKRDKELREKQKKLKFEDKGMTLEQLMELKAENVEIPVNDVNSKIDVMDKKVGRVRFDNFNQQYNKKLYDKDIASIGNSLQKKSIPVYIRKVKKEDSSDAMNFKETWTFELEDANRVRHNLKFDVPRFVDGKYMYLNGNKKEFNNQRFLKPLVKTGPDTVQVCTNYNKIFMTRYGEKIESMFEKFKHMISDNPKLFTLKRGDCRQANKDFKTSIEFDNLAKELSSLTIKTSAKERIDIIFNLAKVKEMMENDKTNVGAEYKKIAGTGRNVIGTFTGPNKTHCLSVDPDSQIVYIGDVPDTGKPEVVSESMEVVVEDTESTTALSGGEGLVSWIIRKLNASGDITVKQFNQYNSGKKFMYTRCKVMKKNVPLVAFLGYCEGLTTVMKKAGITTSFSDTRPRFAGTDSLKKAAVKFSDGYLVYDKFPLQNSLLMNGLTVFDTTGYSYADFDTKNPYMDFLESIGNRALGNALDNFYDWMIDPVSEEVLRSLNYPTEFVDLLLAGNALLADNNFNNENDMNNWRIRKNEMVYAHAYKLIANSYQKYKATASNRNPVKISMPRDAVLKEIMMSQLVEDVSEISPIIELDKAHVITDKGPSGTNLEESYTLERRSYHDTMTGIIAMSTSPDANVGINRKLSLEPNIVNTRGFIAPMDKKAEDSVNMFSPAELLTPMGVTRDDPIRSAMASKQSGHIIPVKDASPVLMSNGVEKALPYHLSSDFSVVAKADGKVVDRDEANHIVIVKYKGIEPPDDVQVIDIGEKVVKNGAGGFFLTTQLNGDKLKKGYSFKKNDILAYNKNFFSESNADGVRMNIGSLIKVACMGSYANFEDGDWATKKMSTKMSSKICMETHCILGPNSNVDYIVKVGDKVEVDQPLIKYDQSTSDAGFNKMLANIGEDLGEDITNLGKVPVKSHYSGVIKDIKLYSTVPTSVMTKSLKKLVDEYWSKIRAKRKRVEKYRKELSSNDYIFTELDKPYESKDGKVGGYKVGEGVLIKFFIEYDDNLDVGDKLVHFAAVKNVNAEMIPEGMEPFSINRPDEEISSSFTTAAINARMVPSVLPTMYGNKILVELKRTLLEMYQKDNPSFKPKDELY